MRAQRSARRELQPRTTAFAPRHVVELQRQRAAVTVDPQRHTHADLLGVRVLGDFEAVLASGLGTCLEHWAVAARAAVGDVLGPGG